MFKVLSSVFALSLIMGGTAIASVSGECANCHTMHNSQGAEVVNVPAGPEEGGTYPTLLVNSCVGCHSGETSTYMLGTSNVPVVNHTGSGAPLDHLAGGNFYWVSDTGGDDDAKGHNVLGISGPDLSITALEGAPGNPYSCANSCHLSLAVEQTAGGAGNLGSGCQGCHLAPAHHADDSGVVVSETGGYYRFLSGHMSGDGHGVEGIEDDDWQATVSAIDHNEYLGNASNLSSSAGFNDQGNTMTASCCGCHGNFHVENGEADGSGVWIRHPSDAVIPTTGEYAAYTVYDPNVPVAREDFVGFTGPLATVAPGTDMVMCLSCHRPHGSPYDDLLRWDYSAMDAGNGGAASGTGCFVCHSGKD